jgi:hypothetical protein
MRHSQCQVIEAHSDEDCRPRTILRTEDVLDRLRDLWHDYSDDPPEQTGIGRAIEEIERMVQEK